MTTKLTGVNNLVKLLPTTTLYIFQTLNPSFTNKGQCYLANKVLSAVLIAICSIGCFLSPFTDTIVGRNGKVFFGIATFKDFHIINFGENDVDALDEAERRRLRLKISDGVHAVLTVLALWALVFEDPYIQQCFFPTTMGNGRQVLSILPLGFAFFASLVFMMTPKTRKGIGYSDENVTVVARQSEQRVAQP